MVIPGPSSGRPAGVVVWGLVRRAAQGALWEPDGVDRVAQELVRERGSPGWGAYSYHWFSSRRGKLSFNLRSLHLG
ncbi:unnamed protein product [Gadus morhua 'NCC']